MESFEVENENGNVNVVGPSRPQRLYDRIRQMSNVERNYFFATCALSITLVALVVATLLSSVFGGGVHYCVSKECIRTAAQIIGSMNSSADPCTDFYEFTCGAWKKIGGDEEDNWSLRMLKDTTRQAATLLSREIAEDELEAVKKAKNIYRSCMATDYLDRLGLEPLMMVLEKAGLPRGVPTRKTAETFDLSRTLARVHRALGKPVLIDVLRETDETFTVWMPPFDIYDTPNIAVLQEIDEWVRLDLDDETRKDLDLLNNSTWKAEWQDFMRNFSLLTDQIEEVRSRRFSEEYEFDQEADFVPPQMKRLRLPASRITTILYNGSVPNDLSNTLLYEVYMETLLEGRPEVNWTLNRGTLRLADPEYHHFLVSAFREYSPVNMRNTDYLGMCRVAYAVFVRGSDFCAEMLVFAEVIKHFGVHTTTSFRQKLKSRQATMKSQSPRSESCAELVISLMPLVVDHLMAQVDPITETTEEVKRMTKEIQFSQRELVEKADWLDPLGKKNILKHLDDVKVARVGYVDWVKEGRGLDEFYKDITVYENELVRTMTEIQVWQVQTNLVVSPVIGRLRTDHLLASAYYYRSLNTVTVRPMIMRFPFYPLGLEALNYGAMGLVLGHEFGHALDAEAFGGGDYFFLEKPAITKVDTFINCTKDGIRELSAKLNASASPELSINEDVSDITGIRTALYTFNKVRRGFEHQLPGLESFTHDQLFFLAFGNVWCTNGKPPGPGAEDGPHNANRFRILSAARNTPEFSKIWNCPADSPMNPRNKCTLW